MRRQRGAWALGVVVGRRSRRRRGLRVDRHCYFSRLNGHRWSVVSEISSQSGLHHFVLLVLLRRCVERWGLGRLVEMLSGTSPWVVVYFPLLPPAHGARPLTIKNVWVLLLSPCLLCSLRTVVLNGCRRSHNTFLPNVGMPLFRSIQTRTS